VEKQVPYRGYPKPGEKARPLGANPFQVPDAFFPHAKTSNFHNTSKIKHPELKSYLAPKMTLAVAGAGKRLGLKSFL
jgi:hypothetical protein